MALTSSDTNTADKIQQFPAAVWCLEHSFYDRDMLDIHSAVLIMCLKQLVRRNTRFKNCHSFSYFETKLANII